MYRHYTYLVKTYCESICDQPKCLVSCHKNYLWEAYEKKKIETFVLKLCIYFAILRVKENQQNKKKNKKANNICNFSLRGVWEAKKKKKIQIQSAIQSLKIWIEC